MPAALSNEVIGIIVGIPSAVCVIVLFIYYCCKRESIQKRNGLKVALTVKALSNQLAAQESSELTEEYNNVEHNNQMAPQNQIHPKNPINFFNNKFSHMTPRQSQTSSNISFVVTGNSSSMVSNNLPPPPPDMV